MAEQPKNPSKPSEPRAFEAALETSLTGVRITRARLPGEPGPAAAGPEKLAVQPPKPEILSRLVNCIKKI